MLLVLVLKHYLILFDALKEKIPNLELDEYFLSDSEEDGKNFRLIKEQSASYTIDYQPPKELRADGFDHFLEKIPILYTHVHRLALKYPNDEIVYQFYNNNSQILEELFVFFDMYPLYCRWIPLRLT